MPEFKFRCPQCLRRLKIEEDLAGAQIRCPACEQVIRVPFPGALSVAEAGAAAERSDRLSGGGTLDAHSARTIVYWRRKRPPTPPPGSEAPLQR